MKRIYETLIVLHFTEDGEMMFLEGPRQVGKTTVSETAETRIIKVSVKA